MFVFSRNANLQDLSIGGGVEVAVVARAAVLHAVWPLLQGIKTREEISHLLTREVRRSGRQRWASVGLCVVTGTVCTVCVCVYLYNWINRPWRQNMVSEQPTAALCWLLVGAFIVTLWRHKHKVGQMRLIKHVLLLSAPLTCRDAA